MIIRCRKQQGDSLLFSPSLNYPSCYGVVLEISWLPQTDWTPLDFPLGIHNAALFTWSGESFPSSATILRKQATDPKRGTASLTLRYLCPLLLNTRITHSSLNQMKRHNQRRMTNVFSFNCPFQLQSSPKPGRDKRRLSWINQNIFNINNKSLGLRFMWPK